MADQTLNFDIDIEGSTEPMPGAKQYDIDMGDDGRQREAKPGAADEDEVIIVDDEPKPKPAARAADVDDADDADDDSAGDSVSEEEMQEASERVRKRINSLTRKRHDAERRAAALVAENANVVALARHQHEKLKQLSELIGNGEKQYVASTIAALDSKVQAAKTKLQQALGQGDPDAVVEAQSELAQAHAEAAQARAYRPVAPSVRAEVEALDSAAAPAPAPPQQFEPDAAAKAWMSKNPWFNDQGNREHVRMRNYAIEFANSLEADGYDPIADAKEYYAAINSEMRARFPEKFKAGTKPAPTPASGRIAPTAGATQASNVGGRKTFTLTASQAQTARRLGIPLAEYAKEYARMYAGEKKS